jgi:hypothetical protein
MHDAKNLLSAIAVIGTLALLGFVTYTMREEHQREDAIHDRVSDPSAALGPVRIVNYASWLKGGERVAWSMQPVLTTCT